MRDFWWEWLEVWQVNMRTFASLQDRIKYLDAARKKGDDHYNQYAGTVAAQWNKSFLSAKLVKSLAKLNGRLKKLMDEAGYSD
jgi:hypothetical protein